MAARWYDMTKELHITLTVKPISKQEIYQLQKQMSRVSQLNTKQNISQLESNDEPKKLESIPETTSTINTATLGKGNVENKGNNNIGNANGNKHEQEQEEPTSSLIDKILKLDDKEEKQQQQQTNEKEKEKVANTNDNINDKDTSMKSKNNKTKKNKKKKRKGAVQAGFLLNNSNFDLSTDQNLKNNNNNNKTNGSIKHDTNDQIIKELTDFKYEFRERLNRIVIVCRIENIIKSSIDVKFNTSSVTMSFETDKNEYYKCINLRHEIDNDKSSFDLNDKNLLLMLIKKDEIIWNGVEKAMECLVDHETKSEENVVNVNNTNTKIQARNESDIIDQLLNDDCTMALE